MAYKDKIYDITALEMFKRLEVFLNSRLSRKPADSEQKPTVERKIDWFCAEEKVPSAWREKMHHIRRRRNDIVHPQDAARLVQFCPNPVQVLDLSQFKKFQKDCFALDNFISPKFGALRMKEIMIPTLEYRIGNAGDLIKHGLLAEFVEWWEGEGRESLQVADTFAGCPWGHLTPDDEVGERLFSLKNCALQRAYPSSTSDLYLGSSHLVRRIAENLGLKASIHMSDRDNAARCNLENSILEHESMQLIHLPKGVDGKAHDGYAILDSDRSGGYDLILIDPYSEFLRDEFFRGSSPKHFTKILNLVKSNQNLFVAVFVLDMKKTNSVGRKFSDFKRDNLRDCSFSLRCPKIVESNLGESRFDSEILLISKQIADRKCGGLHSRLRDFADKATDALKGIKVEFGANGGQK